MKKMLLAGDSFAQVPRGHEHRTFHGIRPVENSLDYDHWCELWAKDLDMEVVVHAVPGGSISSTSFIAMQELMMNDYDLCVFHVSHHGRVAHNNPGDHQEWIEKLYPLIGHSHESYLCGIKSLDMIYDNNIYPLYDEGRCPKFSISSTNPGNVDGVSGDYTVVTTKAPFSYIHDSIGSVLSIKALCEAKNVRLQLARNFCNETCEAIRNLGIDIDYFDVTESERKHNFDVIHSVPSHYDQASHELIYSDFCEYLKKSN